MSNSIIKSLHKIDLPQTIQGIMLRPFGFLAPNFFLNYLAVQSLSVPDEGYSMNVSCPLIYIPTVLLSSYYRGVVVAMIVWQLDLPLAAQSVPITTKVVSSNPVHGEVYSIQHYVIKFVSDLRQVGGYLRVLRFPPPLKLTITI